MALELEHERRRIDRYSDPAARRRAFEALVFSATPDAYAELRRLASGSVGEFRDVKGVLTFQGVRCQADLEPGTPAGECMLIPAVGLMPEP
jgi:hypothetical protein